MVIIWSSDLSRSRRVLYREIVERGAKSSLYIWLDLSAAVLHSFWSWTAAADFLSKSVFSLT